jgi:phospholipid-binding lipoprotein MlaA
MMTTKFLRGALLISVFSLGACSSGPATQPQQYSEPVFSAERVLPKNVESRDAVDVYDPWEGMNRRLYNFNYHFDRLVFIPAVKGYQWITPDIMEKGINNFFNNFRDVNTLLNSILQLSPDKTAQSLGRVMVNSTIGLAGLIDVATNLDIPRPQEDFGQTMGRWGVGTGPYLVVPFLGPNSLRDGIGLIPDLYVQATLQEAVFNDAAEVQIPLTLLNAVNTRANVSFRYYETGSAYEYETIRWLYSTKRELDVAK